MTNSLVTPDSRPKAQVRPTGTSFPGLVGVELRRLWWRRLTKAVIVGVLAFAGLSIYNAYASSTPERLAQTLDDYNVMRADMERQQKEMQAQLPQIIEDCKQQEAQERERSGDPSLSFQCEQQGTFEMPTPEQMGIVSPNADTITATVSASGAYLFAFVAFLLCASFIGAEFTSGAMGNWLTFQPRRIRVALSKLSAAVIGSALLAGLGLLVINVGARMIAVINRPDSTLKLPAPPALADSVPELMLRVVAVAVVAGVIGAALGLVLHHTAAIVGLLLGYGVVVEMIMADILMQGRLRPWVVSTNIDAFLNKGTKYKAESCTATACEYKDQVLAYTHSWVYLLMLGLLAAILAILAFRRRDIT